MATVATIIGIGVIVWFVIALLNINIDRAQDHERWNKGRCSRCDGHWRALDNVHRRFRCSKCGHQLHTTHSVG